MIVHENVSEETPPLLASQYRRLWLDEAHEVGSIAETLAEVLGWQPTPDQPLPDALALAEVAAQRIRLLEGLLSSNAISHDARRNPCGKTNARHKPIFTLN